MALLSACVRNRSAHGWQMGPASLRKVALSEYQPLTPNDEPPKNRHLCQVGTEAIGHGYQWQFRSRERLVNGVEV